MAKNKSKEESQATTTEATTTAPPAEAPPPAVEPMLPVPAGAPDESEAAAAFRGSLAAPQKLPMPLITVVAINHAQRKFMRDGELLLSVFGYPIYFFQVRGWWEKPYQPGSKELPACFSNDMQRPDPASTKQQATSCSKCKMSQFGSHPFGKGQACKTTTLLFIADLANRDQPISVIILPPSSIRSLMGSGGRFPKPGYLQMVKNFKDPTIGKKVSIPQLAWTEWKLYEPMPGSIHAILEPSFVRACQTKEEAIALAKLIDDNMDAMNAFRGDVTVIQGEE